jgi:heme a synthase
MLAMPDSLQGAAPRRAVARFALLTVAYNVGVILWGAYVRATGSGAGCGGHWPLCNGQIIPASAQAQTLIEFLHRVTSGVALVMAAALLIWVWRRTTKGDWARYSAAFAMILLLNEAVLGAMLVLFDHVGMDRSSGRVIFLCLHFGNTLLLLASLSLTAKWLYDSESRFTMKAKRGERIAVGIGLASVIGIGITGSLAALGDTLFPVISLRLALQQDFSSKSDALLRLRLLHPVLAIVASLYVLWIIRKLYRKEDPSPALLSLIVGALIAQVALGLLNVVMLAPVPLQITHLLVADLFWILVVIASADLLLEQASAKTLSPFQQRADSLEPPSLREGAFAKSSR